MIYYTYISYTYSTEFVCASTSNKIVVYMGEGQVIEFHSVTDLGHMTSSEFVHRMNHDF